MSGAPQGTRTQARDQMALAVILILVGVAGLAGQVLHLTANLGGLIVIAIGLGFAVAFAFTRHYGFLVPGGIMTGLGAGIIASESLALADDQPGGAIVLGLGLGFLAIWVVGAIARVERNHPWPLIPGGILAVIGAVLVIGGQMVNLLDYWGIGAIAVGIVVLWRSFAETRARS
jgi:hypothetical protein